MEDNDGMTWTRAHWTCYDAPLPKKCQRMRLGDIWLNEMFYFSKSLFVTTVSNAEKNATLGRRIYTATNIA